MRTFFTILISCFFLFPLTSEEPIPRLSAESEQLATVADCVNVISGEFYQVNPDLYSNNHDAVDLTRYYDSGSNKGGDFGYKFGSGYPTFFLYNPHVKSYNVEIEQREGATLPFHANNKKIKGVIDPRIFEKGYTNCSRDAARLKDATVQISKGVWSLFLSDGTKRYYGYVNTNDICGFYRLLLEEKPNGNKVHFVYNGKCWRPVRTYITNNDESLILSEINLEFPRLRVNAKSNNNQNVSYYYDIKKGKADNYSVKRNCLTGVQSDHFPEISYEYALTTQYPHNLHTVTRISRPEERDLQIVYHPSGRVKAITSPGYQYKFGYEKKRTTVVDALKRVKFFFHENRRLIRIEDPKYRSHCFDWEKNGNLVEERLQDLSGTPLWRRNFDYDDRGNIIESCLIGNITGFGEDVATTRYTYSNDEFNLLLKEVDPCGVQTHFQYKPGTNLLISKRIVLNGQCQERIFYTYDKNAILIETIEDDGSSEDSEDFTNLTYRRITEVTPQLDPNKPGFTQPKMTSEFYVDLQNGEKVPLKRIEFDYDHDLPIAQHIFDAEGNYRYCITKTFNEKRQLIRESNPLGEITEYSYDANFNKISEEKLGSGKKILYTYDKANRVIKQTEEHENSLSLVTHYTYDAVGNLSSETDIYGQKTTYSYDKCDRLISKTDPLGNTTTKTYDIADNETSFTDEDGNTTTTFYNILGDPLHILYPDSSEEHFTYTLKGELASRINRDQSREVYTYDYKGRVIEEHTYSSEGVLLRTKKRGYKGQNLVSEIDPNGNITNYNYDFSGRLIENVAGERKITYTYDSLGRLHKTNQNEIQIKVTLYDALDRPIEERIEDLSGNHYRKTVKAYDIHGNLSEEGVYSDPETYSVTKTFYNSQNLPTLKIDPLENQTKISYEQTDHLTIYTQDPLGQLTIQAFDPLNRLSCNEVQDSSGNAIAKQELIYDGRGNKIRQLDHIYDGILPIGSSEIEWEYDPMSQVLRETEQNQKSTLFSYHQGKLHHLTKPDGVTLTHTYDAVGQLQDLTSSDGTIYYSYQYDASGNLLRVEDLIQQNVTTRIYNRFGQIQSETLANGYSLSYSYDPLGRLIVLTLPDDSTICYLYNALDLTRIDRNNYSYTQTANLIGKPLNSKLFTDTSYTYDLLHRVKNISSPHYTQDLSYDPVGNIIEIEGTQPSQYSYDALYQLLSESEIDYRHDSLNNRLSKNEDSYELNILHQLLSDSHNEYNYDLNGNRIQKDQAAYRYDALNRLIAIDDLTYTYDPFGRLIESQGEKYLYQNDLEIGTLDSLRIPYSGCTISIEMNGSPYQTIQNHRGDIVALIDRSGNVVTTYTYTAFGETTQDGSVTSPWQFTAQRYDAFTNLYHFPKRVYEPEVGRWLTPDPLGFADGPNLYAYVHNNPLIFVDPSGLIAYPLSDNERKVHEEGCRRISERAVYTTLCPGDAITRYARRVSVVWDCLKKGDFSEVKKRWNTRCDAEKCHFFHEMQGDLIGFGAQFTTVGKGAKMLTRAFTELGGYVERFVLRKAENKTVAAPKEGLNNVFPKKPDDLLPTLPRDYKGRVYPTENLRIRPEQHALNPGETFCGRHHGQHYHVEIRRDPTRSWSNKKNVVKIKPENWSPGSGTGFLPGELFPGG